MNLRQAALRGSEGLMVATVARRDCVLYPAPVDASSTGAETARSVQDGDCTPTFRARMRPSGRYAKGVKIIIAVIMVVLGYLGLMVGMFFLMSLGVSEHDHQDYYAPFGDVGPLGAQIFGGLVILGCGGFGFMLPLFLRWMVYEYDRSVLRKQARLGSCDREDERCEHRKSHGNTEAP